ncbi:GCN5-related N-acetyltransferase [Fictibacillus macauensis ZFHKF-1]|uniref:GCN5-related N-acetyltransferase n=1 Tax=Fictibacillus macauensis ZFHKF-1 TaxID=1196324 RepID=I8AK54_9BACL|nr:GNAT family N-acetyltransferase [Fictibacillus macauensis]EIT86212.1 GCN5-related N-acetyltransferase [Fictibacillus macauensis ZFHKF-1]
MTYHIRNMHEEDLEHVQAVARRTWQATYEGIIPAHIQERFITVAYCKESLQQRLLRSSFFVAEVEGNVVGFANYAAGKEEGVLALVALYVLPEHQGTGIGTALLQVGMQLQNVHTMEVDVEQENTIGMTFYVAKGFTVTETFQDDFDGHTLETVRMRRTV